MVGDCSEPRLVSCNFLRGKEAVWQRELGAVALAFNFEL